MVLGWQPKMTETATILTFYYLVLQNRFFLIEKVISISI